MSESVWLSKFTPNFAKIRALACILAIGLALTWLAGCAHSPKPAALSPPSRTVPISAEAADRASRHLAELQTVERSFVLTLTEEELSSYLTEHLEPAGVIRQQIWLGEGKVTFESELAALGGHRLLGALQATCLEGMPQIQLDTLTVDGHRLPRMLLASIEAMANDALADSKSGALIERISIAEGLLKIEGLRSWP